MNCLYCQAPIDGNHRRAYFHKACRTLGRKRYGSAPYWHEKMMYREPPKELPKEEPPKPITYDVPTKGRLSLWQRIIRWIKNLIKWMN